MNRRSFVKSSAAASFLALVPRHVWTPSGIRRVRPLDPGWPSTESWRRLRDAVGGNLFPVDFPITACVGAPDGAECKALSANLKNPYYIGDTPGLTQTLGWVDAWVTKPSVYAVAARNAEDIAATVTFARENNLRLVVKGGAHSYQGTSNAADSLLVWTRHMHDVSMQSDFVPRGCRTAPQRVVNAGSGAVWEQAYDFVTTQNGGYVQGGGCTTVGVAGLIQSGGFGSFSKHFGTAASSLLEAEVVTADGKIRVVNACRDPELFWALKGGGGGTFGVVSRVTLRVHDLPEFGGGAEFSVTATFRRRVSPVDPALRGLLPGIALQRTLGRAGTCFARQPARDQHGASRIGDRGIAPRLETVSRLGGGITRSVHHGVRTKDRQHAAAPLVGPRVEQRAPS